MISYDTHHLLLKKKKKNKKGKKLYESEMHRYLIEMVILHINLFPNTVYQVCANICAVPLHRWLGIQISCWRQGMLAVLNVYENTASESEPSSKVPFPSFLLDTM